MIHFAPLDLALLFLYVVAVLGVGYRASRYVSSSGTEFLLAGRTLTLPIFVATLVSTWYGGILGVGEFSYRYGISNWIVFGTPDYIFSLVFAFLLARRIRNSGHATIPDRLEHAFGRPTALLGAALTVLISTPAPYVLMLGVIAELILGWGLPVSIVVATLVTVVYLWNGGLRADVWVNAVEFVLMFVGFGVMIAYAAGQYGGFDFIRSHVPELHLTWSGGNSWQFILVWFFIAMWTLVDPAFHQRCAAARDARTAQRGILISIVFWFVFDLMTTASGLYARAILPELADPMYSYPLLAETILPAGAKGIFVIGMLATIMSTLSSLMLISGITIGRDLFGRILMKGNHSDYERRWTRYGLAIASIISVAMALLVPSVVGLWYTMGTCIIPGLLVPVLASYLPSMRVSGRVAFASMLGGWGISTASFVTGAFVGANGNPGYWFGLEPMYPGLLVSICIWGTGKVIQRTR